MKLENRKTINVRYELWHEIKIESANIHEEAYSLVERAWDLYKKNKKTPMVIDPDVDLTNKFMRLWNNPKGRKVQLKALIAKFLDDPDF